MLIQDFTIEERIEIVTKSRLFKKSIQMEVVNYYLTDITIWAYNPTGKFWGVVQETRRSFIDKMQSFYNLYVLRNDFENYIKEPLELLGINLEIKKG